MPDALSIFVADMARSLAFYRTLGLDIPAEADGEPHVEHELPGGFRLMWDTHEVVRSFDPGFVPPAERPGGHDAHGGGGVELAHRCDGPGGVDATHALLRDAGYATHLAPFDAFWGQRYAIVVDPDGHHVALYAPAATPATPATPV